MKQLLMFIFLLCSASVSAQDVIVKKDGSTVVCRVVEVTATEITYKKWSDLNGSNFVMDKTLASGINYENGKKETFGETESLYKPNNQNDGVLQYNDRALLAIDAASNNFSNKKTKTLKTIGWVGGPLLVALGTLILVDNNGGHAVFEYSESNVPIGIGLIGLGVVWTPTFLLIANHEKKKIQMLQSSTLYQYDIPFSNGSSLSLGADLLSDRTNGNNAFGLGLRYNF